MYTWARRLREITWSPFPPSFKQDKVSVSLTKIKRFVSTEYSEWNWWPVAVWHHKCKYICPTAAVQVPWLRWTDNLWNFIRCRWCVFLLNWLSLRKPLKILLPKLQPFSIIKQRFHKKFHVEKKACRHIFFNTISSWNFYSPWNQNYFSLNVKGNFQKSFAKFKKITTYQTKVADEIDDKNEVSAGF